RGGLGVARYSRAVLDGRFEEGEELHIRAALVEVRTGDTSHVGLLHVLREQQGRAEEILPVVASLAARYPHNILWHAAVAGYRASLKQREEAQKEPECLAVDLTALPRNFLWLHLTQRLSTVRSDVRGVSAD